MKKCITKISGLNKATSLTSQWGNYGKNGKFNFPVGQLWKKWGEIYFYIIFWGTTSTPHQTGHFF